MGTLHAVLVFFELIMHVSDESVRGGHAAMLLRTSLTDTHPHTVGPDGMSARTNNGCTCTFRSTIHLRTLTLTHAHTRAARQS